MAARERPGRQVFLLVSRVRRAMMGQESRAQRERTGEMVLRGLKVMMAQVLRVLRAM
jgi:hypothetical protein